MRLKRIPLQVNHQNNRVHLLKFYSFPQNSKSVTFRNDGAVLELYSSVSYMLHLGSDSHTLESLSIYYFNFHDISSDSSWLTMILSITWFCTNDLKMLSWTMTDMKTSHCPLICGLCDICSMIIFDVLWSKTLTLIISWKRVLCSEYFSCIEPHNRYRAQKMSHSDRCLECLSSSCFKFCLSVLPLLCKTFARLESF